MNSSNSVSRFLARAARPPTMMIEPVAWRPGRMLLGHRESPRACACTCQVHVRMRRLLCTHAPSSKHRAAPGTSPFHDAKGCCAMLHAPHTPQCAHTEPGQQVRRKHAAAHQAAQSRGDRCRPRWAPRPSSRRQAKAPTRAGQTRTTAARSRRRSTPSSAHAAPSPWCPPGTAALACAGGGLVGAGGRCAQRRCMFASIIRRGAFRRRSARQPSSQWAG
eukprot:363361-Chlamydomonas_euryale.AAC.8